MCRRSTILLHLANLAIFVFMKRLSTTILLLLGFTQILLGQFQFSGKINESLSDGDIYLSLIEDYRKISGVYEDQILMKTTADSLGNFLFQGNNLPNENRIFRIHVDMCPASEQALNHFSGHCNNSREVLFIANNNDTLSLPTSFDQEMFCSIHSKNSKADALLKIDSVKNDMKFAFATYHSEANKKMNTQKWFRKLQDYGEGLQEPLAELSIYGFLSDRSGFFHTFYLNDLSNNQYYEALLSRLESTYPASPYTKQYTSELKADQFLIEDKSEYPWWFFLIGSVLLLFLVLNFYIIGKWFQQKKKKDPGMGLSKQEERIKALILEDKTNKEIADALFISVSTVKTHINNLYKKLDVSSREELKNMNSH